MGPRTSSGIWAAPTAWILLVAVLVRLGRLDLAPAAAAAAVALLGVGAARAVAGARGGVAGLTAELLLVGGGVAVVLAEPAAHRVVIAGAVAATAAALALAAVWRTASASTRPRLAVLVGAAAGAQVAAGAAGAPGAPAKALLVILAATTTAALLARVVRAELAAVAILAVAAAVGSAHTLAWLLPPLMAAALVGLANGWWWAPALAALAAALLPPAGLAVSAGLLVAACRQRRSPAPLLVLPVVAVVAWWRLPLPPEALATPALANVAAAFPLALNALPLLLPVVALGLLGRGRASGDARDALAVGLLVLPWLGRGPWAAATAAALWLAALPAADADPAARRALPITLPWTVAAAVALLLLAPWGGVAVPVVSPAVLAGGWALALVLAPLPHPIVALAWLLPLAGLSWTVPVEGADANLPAGGTLTLPAAPGAGWALLAAARGPAPPGTTVLAGDGIAPLVAGIDIPADGTGGRRPLLLPAALGRGDRAETRGVTRRSGDTSLTLTAAVPAVVRAEPVERWHARRSRFAALLGGALLLLAAALLLPRPPPLPATAGLVVLLGGALAAGSAVEPLARAAFRDVADLATVAWLAAAAMVLPRLRGRRFAAGVLLLLPLALAQPWLRHPAGDEIYHLELQQSLIADHDLDIRNQIDRSNPAEAAYLPHGARLIHSPTLAVVTLPGRLLLGWPGTLLLTALMMAGGAALAARRALELGAGRRRADLAWLLMLASYPAVTFATQLWPAAAGVLLVALALLAAARSRPLAATLAAAAGLLVKVRLGLLLLPMTAAAALRRRRALSLAVAAAAVAAALAGVALLLGTPLGRHHVSELLPGSPGATLRGLWGLAWDAAGGLAFAAPLWLAALLGLPAVWRRGGAGERALIAGGALTVAVLAPRPEWFGGGAPPVRYLVPLLPLVVLATAELLRRRGGRRLLRLLLPWTAVAGWVAVTRPLWLFNSADGGWWLGDRLARALDAAARRVFPSLIRPAPAALLVPVMLVAFAWWWLRRPRPGAAAATLAGLLTVVVAVTGVAEPTVHVADPQVVHRGGGAEPPAGTPGRASMPVWWRLDPAAEVVVPWDPPAARPLTVRLRVVGGEFAAGTLAAWWQGGPAHRQRVAGRQWREVPLPRPNRLGRGRLHLSFTPAPATPHARLLVDTVTAR